jgi:hypothetical protein
MISVGAKLYRGMALERVKKQNTALDYIFVTAVGDTKFLALDTEGKEHTFGQDEADEYYATGWASWIQIKER